MMEAALSPKCWQRCPHVHSVNIQEMYFKCTRKRTHTQRAEKFKKSGSQKVMDHYFMAVHFFLFLSLSQELNEQRRCHLPCAYLSKHETSPFLYSYRDIGQCCLHRHLNFFKVIVTCIKQWLQGQKRTVQC